MEDRGKIIMAPGGRETIKKVLGEIPLTAELYWLLLQGGKPLNTRFSLKKLQAVSAELKEQVEHLREGKPEGKNIFVFASLHFWIEHAALVGLGLSAQGHNVTLGFLPYGEWKTPLNRFDLRRQNLYARRILNEFEPVMDSLSFLNVHLSADPLPDAVAKLVDEVTVYDVQYTLQQEDVDPESDLYRLRHHRNKEAARAALAYLKSKHPDVVVVPNGTLFEFGIVYRVARYLGIPAVTYEFSEQRQRVWLAQNSEVMKQDTTALWEARQGEKLTRTQLNKVKDLFSARQQAQLWQNFKRSWQGLPSQGEEKVRKALGLDDRPVVLLPTNVLGDSLTLGRQAFSKTMADWIIRTVQYFSGREDIQLIIRIHPGEALQKGPSISEAILRDLPELPPHIHLVGPKDKINTYDVVAIADLGLVYTTTVGLEMAMNGIPVIVSGRTHYAGRGFTYDPDSWTGYFKILGQLLDNPTKHRLSKKQLDEAWRYAYYFFFEYPRPFPWHFAQRWDDLTEFPVEKVFKGNGNAGFLETFRYFAGEPLDWKNLH
jgi:hypothetical protein